MEINNKNMDDQYKIFKDTFHNWKGDNEQIDDVLLISIRF